MTIYSVCSSVLGHSGAVELPENPPNPVHLAHTMSPANPSGGFQTPGITILENDTLEVSTMRCLVKSMDAPEVQFLFNYNLKSNVNALKGNFIAHMKRQRGESLRQEDLTVTFAGKPLGTKENIAKLRVPYQTGDRVLTYNASNEPFYISNKNIASSLSSSSLVGQ